jgi:hypothetical protein
MVEKPTIIMCIFILFCFFLVVKSNQDENLDEDIYDLKNACINCDNHNIIRGLLVKRNFGTKRNRGELERIKEKENKKNRMGKLLNNLNQIII